MADSDPNHHLQRFFQLQKTEIRRLEEFIAENSQGFFSFLQNQTSVLYNEKVHVFELFADDGILAKLKNYEKLPPATLKVCQQVCANPLLLTLAESGGFEEKTIDAIVYLIRQLDDDLKANHFDKISFIEENYIEDSCQYWNTAEIEEEEEELRPKKKKKTSKKKVKASVQSTNSSSALQSPSPSPVPSSSSSMSTGSRECSSSYVGSDEVMMQTNNETSEEVKESDPIKLILSRWSHLTQYFNFLSHSSSKQEQQFQGLNRPMLKYEENYRPAYRQTQQTKDNNNNNSNSQSSNNSNHHHKSLRDLLFPIKREAITPTTTPTAILSTKHKSASNYGNDHNNNSFDYNDLYTTYRLEEDIDDEVAIASSLARNGFQAKSNLPLISSWSQLLSSPYSYSQDAVLELWFAENIRHNRKRSFTSLLAETSNNIAVSPSNKRLKQMEQSLHFNIFASVHDFSVPVTSHHPAAWKIGKRPTLQEATASHVTRKPFECIHPAFIAVKTQPETSNHIPREVISIEGRVKAEEMPQPRNPLHLLQLATERLQHYLERFEARNVALLTQIHARCAQEINLSSSLSSALSLPSSSRSSSFPSPVCKEKDRDSLALDGYVAPILKRLNDSYYKLFRFSQPKTGRQIYRKKRLNLISLLPPPSPSMSTFSSSGDNTSSPLSSSYPLKQRQQPTSSEVINLVDDDRSQTPEKKDGKNSSPRKKKNSTPQQINNEENKRCLRPATIRINPFVGNSHENDRNNGNEALSNGKSPATTSLLKRSFSSSSSMINGSHQSPVAEAPVNYVGGVCDSHNFPQNYLAFLSKLKEGDIVSVRMKALPPTRRKGVILQLIKDSGNVRFVKVKLLLSEDSKRGMKASSSDVVKGKGHHSSKAVLFVAVEDCCIEPLSFASQQVPILSNQQLPIPIPSKPAPPTSSSRLADLIKAQALFHSQPPQAQSMTQTHSQPILQPQPPLLTPPTLLLNPPSQPQQPQPLLLHAQQKTQESLRLQQTPAFHMQPHHHLQAELQTLAKLKAEQKQQQLNHQQQQQLLTMQKQHQQQQQQRLPPPPLHLSVNPQGIPLQPLPQSQHLIQQRAALDPNAPLSPPHHPHNPLTIIQPTVNGHNQPIQQPMQQPNPLQQPLRTFSAHSSAVSSAAVANHVAMAQKMLLSSGSAPVTIGGSRAEYVNHFKEYYARPPPANGVSAQQVSALFTPQMTFSLPRPIYVHALPLIQMPDPSLYCQENHIIAAEPLMDRTMHPPLNNHPITGGSVPASDPRSKAAPSLTTILSQSSSDHHNSTAVANNHHFSSHHEANRYATATHVLQGSINGVATSSPHPHSSHHQQPTQQFVPMNGRYPPDYIAYSLNNNHSNIRNNSLPLAPPTRINQGHMARGPPLPTSPPPTTFRLLPGGQLRKNQNNGNSNNSNNASKNNITNNGKHSAHK